MTIVELKDAIENCTLSDEFLILQCNGNHFLGEQYINELCKAKGMHRKHIDALDDVVGNRINMLIPEFSQDLSVLNVETLDEKVDDYSELTNTVVICSKIDKKIATKVESYVVVMPEAGDWQTKAFIKMRCPNLSDEDINLLYSYTGADTYRIDNELYKLEMFDAAEQNDIFREELNDPATDLIPKTPYDQLNFADYLLLGDLTRMKQFEKHMNIYQFDALAVVTVALRKIKQYILLKFNKADALPALKHEFGYDVGNKQYALTRLLNMPIQLGRAMYLLDTLSAIDYRLKNGELDMPREQLLDYIVCKTARLGPTN